MVEEIAKLCGSPWFFTIQEVMCMTPWQIEFILGDWR